MKASFITIPKERRPTTGSKSDFGGQKWYAADVPEDRCGRTFNPGATARMKYTGPLSVLWYIYHNNVCVCPESYVCVNKQTVNRAGKRRVQNKNAGSMSFESFEIVWFVRIGNVFFREGPVHRWPNLGANPYHQLALCIIYRSLSPIGTNFYGYASVSWPPNLGTNPCHQLALW